MRSSDLSRTSWGSAVAQLLSCSAPHNNTNCIKAVMRSTALRPPANLRDLKVARDLHGREYPLDLRLFHGVALDQGTNLVECW